MTKENEILFEATRDTVIADFASGEHSVNYIKGLNDSLAALLGIINHGNPMYDRSFISANEAEISASYNYKLGRESMLAEILEYLSSTIDDWRKDYDNSEDDTECGYMLGAELIKRELEKTYMEKGE